MPARSRNPEKVDFKASHPELYRARKSMEEIRVEKGTYLVVDGQGAPGGREYQEAIGQLFSVGYTLKYFLRGAGVVDFTIPALECLWLDEPGTRPLAQWRWRVMVRVADQVKAGDVTAAKKQVREKKGLDVSAVKRVTWSEGRALQVLHVGPYDAVEHAYRALLEEVSRRGLRRVGVGHELYLNDPRRVGPERTKTIVRVAVRR